VNSIRVHGFFEDFDKLRANSIPYKKFCSGLSMAMEKVTWTLSPEDMLALGEYFKAETPENFLVGNGTTYFHQFFIRWMDFCNEIDSANTIKGLENAPLGETTRSFGASRPGLQENSLGAAAIEKIKTEVRKQGVLVKHFFQDFAANQNSVMITNHVTRQQFEQCIARLKFKVSREEIFAIADMLGGRGDGTVNYRAFVEAVDPAPPSINPWKTNDQIVAAEASGAPAPVAAKPEPISQDAVDVLEKVKAACLKYKIRIHEFFQDFDRLRSGVVTSRQMEIAFNMAFSGLDVGVGPDEVKALTEAYKSDAIPSVTLSKTSGMSGEGAETYHSSNFVRWHDLADEIDSVFTVKGLASMSPAMETTTGLPPLAVTNTDISADDEALAASASARMKNTLDTERIMLRWVFDDFAANKNSPMRVHCVTHQQFKQVLAMLKLPVERDGAEMAALLRKYDLKKDGFINYNSFCTDLQPPPPHINPWKTVGA
jgi:Ca2+-binding EF-hand superfamily protein